MKGHFAAHARYLLRDRAAGSNGAYGNLEGRSLIDALANWQSAGDKRIFKVILSPEFGDRVDLTTLATGFMTRLGRDFGEPLQWGAVNHHNTDHPHVHVVIRGRTARGAEVRFPAPYIKDALRDHACALCTEQLGFRTLEDVRQARAREVRLYRFTSLDRMLLREAGIDSRDGSADGAGQYAAPDPASPEDYLLAARARFLATIGLAEAEGPNAWRLRSKLEPTLRSMQLAGDRQRMLARAGAAISDQRLPHRSTPANTISHLRGRVLGHVADDGGLPYLILEGTDATVHFIRETPALQRARSQGQLVANQFIELEAQPYGLAVHSHGNALRLDGRSQVFQKQLANEGAAVNQAWSGWLGTFHAHLRQAASTTLHRLQHER